MKAIANTLLALSGVALVAVGTTALGKESEPEKPSESKPDRTLTVTEIVSDQTGARKTDPELVNAWGLAFDQGGVAWVAANGTGVAKAYAPNGHAERPTLTFPSPDGTSPAAVTGEVINRDAHAFQGDHLLFVTEDGIIAGAPGGDENQVIQRVDNSAAGAVYKGVTIAKDSNGAPRLFATDFHGAKIDVFDTSYAPVESKGFVDPELPSGFAPFNVEAAHAR